MGTSPTDSEALKKLLSKLQHLQILPGRVTMFQNGDCVTGGFCEVRFGTLDVSTPRERQVAVKLLRPAGKMPQRTRLALRLARELRPWATLDHPNILPLVGFYLSDEMTIAQLISPFEPHGDIADYLKAAKPDEAERLRLAQDTIEGLVYLHGLDPPICHGDLKTLNVLVSVELRAKLCDFGLATIIDGCPSGLTTSTPHDGTTCYNSPELAQDGLRTLHSDVWALGCLLIEILYDVSPYSHITNRRKSAIIIALSRGKLPAILDNLAITDRMRSLVERCWNIRAKERPTALRLKTRLLGQ